MNEEDFNSVEEEGKAKRKIFLITLIIVVILFIGAIFLVSYDNKEYARQDNETKGEEEISVIDSIVKERSIELTSSLSITNDEYKKIYDDVGDTVLTQRLVLPKLNIDSSLNNEILNDFKEYIDSFLEEDFYSNLDISYEYKNLNNIIYINIKLVTDDTSKRLGYYYDTSNKTTLSLKEVLSILGISDSNLYAGLENSKYSYYYIDDISSLSLLNDSLDSKENLSIMPLNNNYIVYLNTDSNYLSFNSNNTDTPFVEDGFNKKQSITITEELANTNEVYKKIYLDSGTSKEIEENVSLPKINIESATVENLNKAILNNYKKYTDLFSSDLIEVGAIVNYNYKVYDNIIFIVIDSYYYEYPTGKYSTNCYYYDITNDKELSLNDILDRFGISSDDILSSYKENNYSNIETIKNYINDGILPVVPTGNDNEYLVRIYTSNGKYITITIKK